MRIALLAFALFASLILAACSSVPLNQPPVEQRSFQKIPPVVAPGGTSAPAASAGAVVANPGPVISPSASAKPAPGTYVVQPGDTLYRIATQFNTTWQNLAQWNNLTDPNAIEVGQVLRVTPPGQAATAASAAPAPGPGAAQSFPVAPAASSTHAAAAPTPAAPVPAPRPAASNTPPVPAPVPAAPVTIDKNLATATHDGIVWSWPSSGKVIQEFNGITSKGIDIAGNLGDPVYAAAAGRVVYAGSELRGFGKLIIIKHNDDYISVYAHNNVLLVKEGETVKRGQKIAEMGNTDAPRVELHFEIRLRGKSVNPLGLLPKQN